MAQVVFNIPDGVVGRINNAFAATYDFAKNGGGLTQTQFTKKKIAEYTISVIAAFESNQAALIAKNVSINDVNTNVIIT